VVERLFGQHQKAGISTIENVGHLRDIEQVLLTAMTAFDSDGDVTDKLDGQHFIAWCKALTQDCNSAPPARRHKELLGLYLALLVPSVLDDYESVSVEGTFVVDE
jgi:hypothetical protein